MRNPITLRLDADLLAAARVEAKRDSRTLTNLIEFALKRHLARTGAAGVPERAKDAMEHPEDSGAPFGGGVPGQAR